MPTDISGLARGKPAARFSAQTPACQFANCLPKINPYLIVTRSSGFYYRPLFIGQRDETYRPFPNPADEK